ncbi:MAG: DUF2066 domain-containing protein [Spiribacter sp.]|nr:DUF2066 domain-containing protein [Spiribacter sp.]MDR9480209.1 DUF2066 domain-containing protein [Spiribacter sp.]
MPKTTMMRRLGVVWLLALVGLANPVHASTISGQIEVKVADESSAARAPAVTEAVDALLIQLTGRDGVVDLPVAAGIREQASRYLQGYSYRHGPAPGVTEPDASAEQTWLNARFDVSALRDRLVRRGVEVWPERRPRVLLWMAIERGAERRFGDPQTDAQWHQTLQDEAAKRGVQLLLPLLDLEDRQALQPADVAAGFAQPIQAASVRYAPDRIVSVRLNDGRGERMTSRWTLMSDEAVQQRWRITDANLDATVQQSVKQLVEPLRRDLAFLPDLFASGRLQIAVTGIDGLSTHDRIRERLASVAGVERVTTLAVDGDRVRFGLAITTPAEAVREAIERDNRLLADGEQYRWQSGR